MKLYFKESVFQILKKLKEVISIFKKGNPSYNQNYTQIYWLPIISKSVEK